MTSFVLVPGAGGSAWYWHRVAPLLEERVARERLGKIADVIRGGHLVALSNPRGLADRLIAYAASAK